MFYLHIYITPHFVFVKVGKKMKKTLFIKNAAILTVSPLILRFAGIIFKVWLAALIGSEGIGLYHLIFSVYMLASTFASSGLSTAVTRLVAEEMALGSKSGSLKILRRGIEITLIIALLSSTAVYFSANYIGSEFIGDLRSVPAIKIMPFSLPLMGISSCLRGYFIARRKVTPNAFSQLSEQAVRISVVIVLAKTFINKGLGACLAAVMLGDVISELAGLLLLSVTYIFDSKKLSLLNGRNYPDYRITKRLAKISLPITGGRYLNTLLRTGENILVPKALSKYPLGTENVLSSFGMIKGMALPILFFPSAILGAVSTLLIPEMSEAMAKKHSLTVRSACERIIKLTSAVSFIFAAIFFVSGERIGIIIYKEPQVGTLIKYLSPIVPLMYLDSVSDGILKGLDQQNYTFWTALGDSSLRIVLITALLPISGLKGFIAIMYFSNILTCLLHLSRLIKISTARIKMIKEIFLPVSFATVICLVSDTVLSIFDIKADLVYIMLLCGIALPIYFIFLWLNGNLNIIRNS